MDHIVEIDHLSKNYETGFWTKKHVRALDDLSLSIAPGQIFGFLGGNGAGKTTTIKILMGLLFPTSGTARILGRDISDTAMHSHIGYCPENPYFYDYLTAYELMDYFGRLLGLAPAARKQKTEELLTKVGVEERSWNKQLRKFSKGMLQRVGLAQSLINEPEIVFMDEPMSGLDPVGRREIRELIAGLRDHGTTVFMSTHILSDVEALCSEVAILRNGRLAATGRLSELMVESEGARAFEIIAGGIATDVIAGAAAGLPGSRVFSKPNGTCIEILGEDQIGAAIDVVRNAGGRIISVNPVKQSLEELFVEKSSNASEDRPVS